MLAVFQLFSAERMSKLVKGGMGMFHGVEVLSSHFSTDGNYYKRIPVIQFLEVFSFQNASSFFGVEESVQATLYVFFPIIEVYAFSSIFFADFNEENVTSPRLKRSLTCYSFGGRHVH